MSCIIGARDSGEHWWFEFADESGFISSRTPRWARRVAESMSKGAFVTTGLRPDKETWDIQSIQITKTGKSYDKARDLAGRIYIKIKKEKNVSESCRIEFGTMT